MAINRIDPEMVEGTAIVGAKAGADSGGTSGQVVILNASNDIATGYLDTGTTNGKVVLAGGSDKIATSLIDTGTSADQLVQMQSGPKLPAVDGGDLTLSLASISAAMPTGFPIQTVTKQLKTKFEADIDIADGDFYTTPIDDGIGNALTLNITPSLAGGSFKIDVTWSGGYESATNSSDEDEYRQLGFYLIQIVDLAGSDTTSDLKGTVQDDRMPIIAPVSTGHHDGTNTTNAKYLLSCNFSYIATPSYTLSDVLQYKLACRIDQPDTSIWTNRTVTNSDNTFSHRSVSSISITELKG